MKTCVFYLCVQQQKLPVNMSDAQSGTRAQSRAYARTRTRVRTPSDKGSRQSHERPRTPPLPWTPPPKTSAPVRQWEQINPEGSTQLKNVFQKMIDPDSYWSVATAGVATLIATCLLLLSTRPFIVLQKNEDGTVEQGRVCVTRLLVTSVIAAAIVTGVCVYLKWRRGQAKLS